MSSPLFYEDFEPGQSFTSAPARMERDRLVAFATEFDPQPQHLDDAGARDSLFGTLVASGWHTAALSMRLQLAAMMDRIPGGAMGASIDQMVWRRPVLPGDMLHVVIDVMAKRTTRSRPDRGLLTLRSTTLNQNGEPVLEMTSAILVPRRNPGATEPPPLTEA